MAISFVGSASATAIDGGNPSIDLTAIAGLAQNDLVIVGYVIGAGTNNDIDMSISSPIDYTEIADLFSNDNIEANLGVFRKFMGETPDTTVVCVGDGNANSGVAAVAMAFRGVDTTTPMDVAATTATGLSSMHPDPPSIDWVTANTWTVIVGASGHGQNVRSYTFPTGYTTNAIDATGNDLNDGTVGIGYKTAPSDPENPGVMTLAGTDSATYAWAAVTIALREAVGGSQFILVTAGV